MCNEQLSMTKLWHGKLVRLAARNVETAALEARWERDSEFHRLSSAQPAYPVTVNQAKHWFDDLGPNRFRFAIHALSDDRFLGDVGLWIGSWASGEAWVGIGIGERSDWGKGYGTDAMRLILRYAFAELNLFRVSLDVLGSNARAIRSYEKCGFVREGEVRDAARYDGQYISEVHMGILRDEWEAMFNEQ
jgi:RimJ/RimL family protein N-acetyltransferase